MITTEMWTFIGFIGFILFMLIIDLGIFDKKSHEIKFGEAIAWTIVWVGFAIGFYFILLYHGEKVHGIDNMAELNSKISQYRQHIIIPENTTFEDALKAYNKNLSLEYITGYLIEYMLSVDNVFVMILIFISFGVPKMYYKRVLMWGIIGAIIMRFFFIFVSAALIQRFSWILYIFGIFLVYTGIKMFLERNKNDNIDTKKHPVVKFFSKYFRVYPNYHHHHFWFKNSNDNNRIYFTPLLIVLLVIEFSDLIFAVDSVPAIFSVTQDPYIVFFSNIFAIMGLRSLFFVVSHVISLFRFLKHGLAILLSFIGFKMLLHSQLHDWGFTNFHSLLVIIAILGTSIVASLIWPKKQKKIEKEIEVLTGEKVMDL